MPSVLEELTRVNWLIKEGKISGEDRCKLVIPKIDAKERIRNEKKQRRIVLVTDEFGFSQFHARKEAWMLALHNNPATFMAALDRAMETFDVKGWVEEQESSHAESLGDA
jgi:hypothetical protein